MKKIIYSLLVVLVITTLTKSQESKNTFGISFGHAFKHEDAIYIDLGDNSTWPDHNGNIFINLFYDYHFSESFKVGIHAEYEKSKFEDFYFGNSSANRYVFGFHWIGQYPKTSFHGELGGYFNSGIITHDDFEHNPFGIEYGLIVGPALELNKISVALHFEPGMSYFFSDEQPQAVLVFYPRLLIKFGYKF